MDDKEIVEVANFFELITKKSGHWHYEREGVFFKVPGRYSLMKVVKQNYDKEVVITLELIQIEAP